MYKENLGTGIPTPVTPEIERVKRNQENFSSVFTNMLNEKLFPTLISDQNNPWSFLKSNIITIQCGVCECVSVCMWVYTIISPKQSGLTRNNSFSDSTLTFSVTDKCAYFDLKHYVKLIQDTSSLYSSPKMIFTFSIPELSLKSSSLKVWSKQWKYYPY